MGFIKKIFSPPKIPQVQQVSQKKITSDAAGIANKTIASARKKRQGFLSTIATSPQGLGGDETINTKTLLG
mgnify:FL=1